VEAERLNSALLGDLAQELEGKTPAELEDLQRRLAVLLSPKAAP
jgi:hypothetical protein